MADTVTNRTLISGSKRHIIHLTNESDGTGESAVVKIDKSTLETIEGIEPSSLALVSARWSVQGYNFVKIQWDRSSALDILVMSGDGFVNFEDISSMADPGSGGTGDIILTTDGLAVGNSYDITLSFRLKK